MQEGKVCRQLATTCYLFLMTVRIKEMQNIYYVAVDNAFLPKSLTIELLLFSFKVPDFLGKTSSSSLFHQYELILTLDFAG